MPLSFSRTNYKPILAPRLGNAKALLLHLSRSTSPIKRPLRRRDKRQSNVPASSPLIGREYKAKAQFCQFAVWKEFFAILNYMDRRSFALIGIAVAGIALLGMFIVFRTPGTSPHSVIMPTTELMLSSAAFQHNALIPSQYTCDADDINPPFSISGVPEGTRSLVLIMDDPDAPVGTWDHWIVFNIPPDTDEIREGKEPGGIPGNNSWGRGGYGGPCPPSGTHHYVFKLYALDTVLPLQKGTTKQEIQWAMDGHILAETQLIGTYQRN